MARDQYASVEAFLDALTPEVRDAVERLRRLITAAEPRLTETVKWNSPNYVLDGVDRLTVNVDRAGLVRLILHRGTEVAEQKGAAPNFEGDPHGLLTWHSDIRASLLVTDALDEDAATDVVRAWLAFQAES